MNQTPVIKASPVRPEERIQAIDILRGFAIFGILVVNLSTYTFSGISPSLPDKIAEWVITFFAQAKFYTMFSFLFGLGMAIMYLRAEERGTRFFPVYLRRLLILLIFGLIHLILIWDGDILTIYAVLGMILLIFFRKCKPRTLLIWAAVWLGILLLMAIGVAIALAILLPGMAEAGLDIVIGASQQPVYGNGTYLEIVQFRLAEIAAQWPFAFIMAPHLLAMMSLGLYAGKRRLFENIEANLPLIRKIWWVGLIVGVIGNLAFLIASLFLGESLALIAPMTGLMLISYILGMPAMSLFYMTSVVLLTRRPAWLQRLKPLAAVGRMAITNYLLQSVICTLVFYSYGLGLYLQIGPALGLLMTVGIYALQVPFSIWWLKHFRFGPVEWLWRSLTYLKPQPMRRASAPGNN